ncbi:MAG: triose-phosphate isomerase [Sulfurospirillaceae bacterium]|nr:triose-phosphate isomerase [Sulfurospirillaceae bacterium]
MIIASNFKTNHTRASTKDFVDYINNQDSFCDVRIFPPFTALDMFELTPNIKLGVQNFYPADNGSFTGEIGYEQLEEFDIDTVLIGHSERRHILGETQSEICRKFNFARDKESEIIYCVGEPKEVRAEGIEAVMSYIWEQFEGIDIDYDDLIVAYEPVWAIGTGIVAKQEDIDEVLNNLRIKIKAPLLYGGSVKVDNTQEILSLTNCDGVLVGTASWEKENFSKMIEIADNITKD